MVKSAIMKGQRSIRGLGYAEINGLLVPVCGSKFFDFSEGMVVRYREEALQMVRPEMQMEAALSITIVKPGTGYTAEVFLNQHGRPRTKISNNGVAVEGIPDVLVFGEYTGQWVVQTRGPFAIRWPEIIIADDATTGPVNQIDSKSPYIITAYTGDDAVTIDTEIYIP